MINCWKPGTGLQGFSSELTIKLNWSIGCFVRNVVFPIELVKTSIIFYLVRLLDLYYSCLSYAFRQVGHLMPCNLKLRFPEYEGFALPCSFCFVDVVFSALSPVCSFFISFRLRSSFWVCLLQEKVLGPSDPDSGKGKSKMSHCITHGYHLVKGKSHHAMEDYVVAQFKQIEDHELGLFAIFDGHLSHEIPEYLQNNLFNNILKEVIYQHETLP